MIISWNTTRACNLNCKHCYRDAGSKDKNELSFKEAKALLEEIKLAGFKIVVLSGGEPLLRKDIYGIVEYTRYLGMKAVLGTNGTLINEEVARKLKKAGLSRVGISLDSQNPKLHDDFRNFKGAFDKVLSAIQALKKVGLEFQIHTTLTKHNYKEIDSLINLAGELGASAYHIFFLVPTGRGRKQSEDVVPVRDYYRLLSKILDRQKEVSLELKPVCAPQFLPLALKKGMNLRFMRGCLAGISYCCILPNGDVHPCPYLPLKLSNVRKEKFSVIWKDNKIFKELRTLNYKGRCRECIYKELCGGCRARAYLYFDDFMHQDYYCIAETLKSNNPTLSSVKIDKDY